MSLAVVVGVGVTILVFMLFTKLIDSSRHRQIKNFLLIVVFPFLFLIPASLVLDQNVCEVVLTNQSTYYRYGSNFSNSSGDPTYHWDYGDPPTFLPNEDVAYLFHDYTTYTYDEHCYTKQNGSTAFIKALSIILICFMTYMLILFGGDLIKALKDSVRKI